MNWRKLDFYTFEPPYICYCGAPSGQSALANSQTAYYNTLTQEATTEYGEAQGLTNDLTSVFEPIFAAGPNQQGFSAGELTDLNAQATTATGQGYAAESAALGGKIGAEGGGNEYVPQGANKQINAELATSAENQTAGELNQIQLAGYQQGYNQWLAAAQGLGEAASVMGAGNGAGGVANQAGSAANSTWQAVSAENNSWMSLAGAALGGAGSALSGTDLSCYIAAELYGGWATPEVFIIRRAFATWKNESLVGKVFITLYEKLGKYVAKLVRRSKRVRGMFRILFDGVIAVERHRVFGTGNLHCE